MMKQRKNYILFSLGTILSVSVGLLLKHGISAHDDSSQESHGDLTRSSSSSLHDHPASQVSKKEELIISEQASSQVNTLPVAKKNTLVTDSQKSTLLNTDNFVVAPPTEVPMTHLLTQQDVKLFHPNVSPLVLEALQKSIEREIGVGEIDPSNPEYKVRWDKALRSSAEKIKSVYGTQLYSELIRLQHVKELEDRKLSK
jgi:hypothetical protein